MIPVEANVTIPDPTFPMQFEVAFSEGSGVVFADLNLYYCEAETQALCLFDQVRLRIPLAVCGEHGSVAGLTYEIPAPELPNN